MIENWDRRVIVNRYIYNRHTLFSLYKADNANTYNVHVIMRYWYTQSWHVFMSALFYACPSSANTNVSFARPYVCVLLYSIGYVLNNSSIRHSSCLILNWLRTSVLKEFITLNAVLLFISVYVFKTKLKLRKDRSCKVCTACLFNIIQLQENIVT